MGNLASLGITNDGTAPTNTIPPGWCKAQIVGAKFKDSKDMTSSRLEMEIEILDGTSTGRRFFDSAYTAGPSQAGLEMGKQLLEKIAFGVGLRVLNDTDEMTLKPFEVKVGVRKGEGQYGDSNNIKECKPITNAPPLAQGGVANTDATQQQAAPQQQAAQGTPAFLRN